MDPAATLAAILQGDLDLIRAYNDWVGRGGFHAQVHVQNEGTYPVIAVSHTLMFGLCFTLRGDENEDRYAYALRHRITVV